MLRVAFALATALFSIGPLFAADSFPHTAYVTLDSTSVRSGPSDSFYPTSRLRWGAPVEVYRHDAKWAAIRPPHDSYSWVPEHAIEVASPDAAVGKVIATGIKTRIGSLIDESHQGVEYITLKPGELVEIQSYERRGGQGWYRIVPPAGEFRWLRVSDLTKTDPTVVQTAEPDRLTLQTPQTAVARADFVETDDSVLELAQFETSSELTSPPPATGLLSAPSVDAPTSNLDRGSVSGPSSVSGPVNRIDGGGFETSQDYALSVNGPAIDGQFQNILPRYGMGTGLPPEPTTMIKPGPVAKHLLQTELADVELQLALTVSQPTVAWDMLPLRIRAQAVIDSSDDPEMRSRATSVLSKIAQFADIQRRQLSVETEAAQLAATFGGPSVLATTYGNGQYLAGTGSYSGQGVVMNDTRRFDSTAASSTAYNYDGTGWLMPVVTDRADMPKYVLTDSQGEILQFVSPTPGMNLKSYVSKQVGIIGKRDRWADTDQPHIVADRVISLEKVRR
jgi:SH3-like domain-containing protein